MKILQVTESSQKVAITGIRGAVIENTDNTLKELDQIKGSAVFQIFDSNQVAGWRHLYYSAVNALNAMESGEAVSDNLEVEAMLYASAQDQISKAIKMMGVTPKTKEIALLVISKDPKNIAQEIAKHLGEVDDNVLKLDQKKYDRLRKTYSITEKALETFKGHKYEALESLIIEKCALMSLHR
jgi:tRNA threonylcarbamoyladenosine modification (KEOPS) complex Cgi121 subunit